MRTRPATIDDSDNRYLEWNDHINASALYRRLFGEELTDRDGDSEHLRDLLKRARTWDETNADITDETDRSDDGAALVKDADD